ncbi:hypothetical protein L2E82_31927 [Cichorium intybus]|uniref:Uncharacterized protein n=1 Tax=Cichorium intybus TaxID=13427 RepID=A0ACB9BFT0_CICIN|nr:hypothetical protein L2E82_31927 [Cichorium intybus]
MKSGRNFVISKTAGEDDEKAPYGIVPTGSISGSIDKEYRDEVGTLLFTSSSCRYFLVIALTISEVDYLIVIGAELPSGQERYNWWQVFYQSSVFPTMARVLLLDVALNWLTCFPISAKKHLYDVFFLRGCISEVVQTLVPYLQHHSNGRLETTVCSNTERLLALCLLENDGVLRLAREFSHQFNDKAAISRVAHLLLYL